MGSRFGKYLTADEEEEDAHMAQLATAICVLINAKQESQTKCFMYEPHFLQLNSKKLYSKFKGQYCVDSCFGIFPHFPTTSTNLLLGSMPPLIFFQTLVA